MRRRAIGALAAGAAIALGAAGCGGSDEEGSATENAAALSKEDFIAQADQICTDGDASIDAAGQEQFASGQPTDEELTQFFVDTVLPTIGDEIDEIRTLGVPEGDEELVTAVLDSAEQAVADATADPESLTGGSDPFAESNKLATAYGLEVCGG